MSPYVGRLAPSPTGAQHVGNARTYLIAWLRARSRGGRLVLRIEDVDTPRVKPWARQQVFDDLAWLGLDYDGEPVDQTSRIDAHRAALERLKEFGAVYPCTCSRLDIEHAASAPHAEHEGPAYPGTCSNNTPADAERLRAAGVPFAWRLRVRESPAFIDGYYGPLAPDIVAVGGDFVVWKKNDTPAYQLAVVVDDAGAGVTEVVRGDDLIPSTPRQIMLHRLLGSEQPAYAHVPLVVGPDGRRLAKRHGDTRLSALRAAGVGAEALVGLLAWSCGWLAEPGPIAPRELVEMFNLGAIPRRPFVLGGEELGRIGYQAPSGPPAARLPRRRPA